MTMPQYEDYGRPVKSTCTSSSSSPDRTRTRTTAVASGLTAVTTYANNFPTDSCIDTC